MSASESDCQAPINYGSGSAFFIRSYPLPGRDENGGERVMAVISQKALLQKGLWFVHMGSVFKMLARMKGRRGRPFFFFEGRAYTYGEVYEQSLRYAELFSFCRRQRHDQGRLKPGDPLAV